MSFYTQSPAYATLYEQDIYTSAYEDTRRNDAVIQGDVQNERRPLFSGEKLVHELGSNIMQQSEIPPPYTAQPYFHNSPLNVATQTATMLDLTLRAPQVATSNVNIVLVECSVYGTPKYMPVHRPSTHSPSTGLRFHSYQEYAQPGPYDAYASHTYSPAYDYDSPPLPTPTATWLHPPSTPPIHPMSLAPSHPTQTHYPLYSPTTMPMEQEPLVNNFYHPPTPPVPPNSSQSGAISAKPLRKRAAKRRRPSKPYGTTGRTSRRCKALDLDPRADIGNNEQFSTLQTSLQGVYTHRIFPCAWDGCRTQIRREDFYGPSGAEDYQRQIWNHLECHFNPKFRDGSRMNYRTAVIHVAKGKKYHFDCRWAGCRKYWRAQTPKDMHRHVRTHLDGNWKCICGECGKPLSRSDLLRQHEKKYHEKEKKTETLLVINAEYEHLNVA